MVPSIRAHLPLAIAAALACSLAAHAADDETRRLDQIIVSASAREEALRDAPAAVTVITREQLQIRPVRDVLDAIREVPGVTLSGINFTRRGISLRGLQPGQTLYLIDGRRVANASDVVAHADFELSWIPIEAIERIEVVRGPLSSLYGSEALGGVVNIITRPIRDTWIGSVRTRVGSPTGQSGGNEYQVGAFGTGPLGDRFALRTYAEVQSVGHTPDPDDRDTSGIEGRRIESAGGTLGWQLAEYQRIELMLTGSEETRSRRTRGTGPLADRTYWFWDDISRRMGDLRYTADLGGNELQVGLYRSEVSRENRRELTAPSEPTALRDDIVDARYRFEIGTLHEILLGAEARRERLDDGGFVDTGREQVDRSALLLQDRIALGDSWLLTLGGRWDRHDTFGTQFTPRAYVNWHASERLTLRGGYGEGFKAPTLKQLSPQFQSVGGGGAFVIRGNPELNPETSRNAELGLLYGSNGLRAEVTAFRNDAIDLIETFCVSDCGRRGAERRTYVNVARARILGLESGISAELPGGFDAGISHTWLDSENRETGEALLQRAEHTLVSRLGYSGGPWTLQLRGQYTGRQYTTFARQRVELPGFTLWHLNAARELGHGVTVRAGIENLGDTRLADRSPAFNHAERGRFGYVGLDWSF